MAHDKPPSMLAEFGGERPPAPPWFVQAIGDAPTRAEVSVRGVNIETLSWGPVGAPGLLLLHGGMAHADWWSFIAPFFSGSHRVVAPSWSGMGGSGWRDSYSIEGYVEEMLAVSEAGGLFRSERKPVVLAHSFGGFPTMAAARLHGDKFAGVIILDAPVLSPEQRAKRAERRRDEKPPRDTLVYNSEAEALARFRFSPTQTCANPCLVDWIARTSLRPAAKADGHMGVTWKFDPFMWTRLKRTDANTDLCGATCRVCMMWGGSSSLFTPETIAYVKRTAPAGSLFVEIPEAAHHVMADQPLALVSAVRVLLEAWQ